MYNVHAHVGKREMEGGREGGGAHSPLLEELTVAVDAFGGVCEKENH